MNDRNGPGMYLHWEKTVEPEAIRRGMTTIEQRGGVRIVQTAFDDGAIYVTVTRRGGTRVKCHYLPSHGWVTDGEDWHCDICKHHRSETP